MLKSQQNEFHIIIKNLGMSQIMESNSSKNEVSVKVQHMQQQAISDSMNEGRWTEQENLKYVIFLDKNKQQFSRRLKRQKIRLFEQMSEFIGSRTTTQCRTHHQKYEQKFRNFKTIISIYKEEIGYENYKKTLVDLNTKGIWTKPEITPPNSEPIKIQGKINGRPIMTDMAIQTELIDQPSPFEFKDQQWVSCVQFSPFWFFL